jgi:hypothetical protein
VSTGLITAESAQDYFLRRLEKEKRKRDEAGLSEGRDSEDSDSDDEDSTSRCRVITLCNYLSDI